MHSSTQTTHSLVAYGHVRGTFYVKADALCRLTRGSSVHSVCNACLVCILLSGTSSVVKRGRHNNLVVCAFLSRVLDLACLHVVALQNTTSRECPAISVIADFGQFKQHVSAAEKRRERRVRTTALYHVLTHAAVAPALHREVVAVPPQPHQCGSSCGALGPDLCSLRQLGLVFQVQPQGVMITTRRSPRELAPSSTRGTRCVPSFNLRFSRCSRFC